MTDTEREQQICPVCGHKGSAMHFTDDYDHGFADGQRTGAEAMQAVGKKAKQEKNEDRESR